MFPFLQLEDDIVAKPNYLSTMKNFALQQPSEEWMILEFSQLGFIGNVFFFFLILCKGSLCLFPLSFWLKCLKAKCEVSLGLHMWLNLCALLRVNETLLYCE